MRNVVKIFVFCLLFILMITSVKAESFKYGYVTGEGGVYVRSGPGISHNAYEDGIKEGGQIKIISEHKVDDNTDKCMNWYKIVYLKSEDQTGYVCSDFIKLIEIQTNEDFEKNLLNFPESYHDGLRLIHSIFPNSIFKPFKTRLDFNTVVKNESVLGKSLIWDSIPNHRDGLKHLDSYNMDTNSFSNSFPGGGANWYAASEEIIAYYLDPRNFFNEKSIFMFESLSYAPSTHTVDGVSSILDGSFMAKDKVDGTDKTFAQVIMEAGSSSNISPYYLASRILQETGYGRSALVKGVYPNYPEYNGYYNFFNYGAGGTNVIKNGLQFAFDKGWNSEEKAIKGGTNLIGTSYIAEGQDTNYFQKWDVVCYLDDISKCPLYSHQYMQNIEAPTNESSYTFNGYKDIFKENVYNIPFIFSIPIYDNMPDKVNYPSEKNPINFLKELKINDQLLANFNSYNNEYEITLPNGTTSIKIDALAVDNRSKINGIGEVNITNVDNIKISVLAENGKENIYNIKVKFIDSDMITLEQTIKKVTNGIIKGDTLTSLTNVDMVKEEFLKANSLTKIEIKDIEDKIVTTGDLGTGYKVKITVGNESKVFNVIIFGDTNGDKKIDILDLLRIQKHILGVANLDGIQIKASDVSKDDTVDILDLLKVQKHILGVNLIKQ